MANVIGVRFRTVGKVYYFNPGEFWPKPGDNVIVETVRGIEFGEVVTGTRTFAEEQLNAPLKKVIRMATKEDIAQAELNRKREKEAFTICRARIAEHKLEMKLIAVEYTFDGSKIIFYFTANGRVDFRDLVKDLAGVFRMRIELRQIGVRDEAKFMGGLGSCGRSICCGTFLGDFQPVSIKMAKEQNLSLNPTKISGLCGRLMCCLKYEQDNYEEVLKRVPKPGKDIVTPDGPGILSEVNVIKETVKVRIHTDDDSFDVLEYPIEACSRPNPSEVQALREKRMAHNAAKAEAPAESNEESVEEGKKRRFLRQKAHKAQSTEEFLEKNAPNTDAVDKPEKVDKPHRKKKSGKPHTSEQKSEEAPSDHE